MLRDKVQGAHLLDVRKQLAFQGWVRRFRSYPALEADPLRFADVQEAPEPGLRPSQRHRPSQEPSRRRSSRQERDAERGRLRLWSQLVRVTVYRRE